MHSTVIDTLKFANRLKKAGFAPPQAEGLARALGAELAERMVTKRELDEAVQTLCGAIATAEAKFESRFEALEPRFDAIDARFEALEPGFGAIDAKFEALEPRFGAIDARFDAIDAKLESQSREFSSRLNVLFGTMALGFTLIIGLIGYSLFSPRGADSGVAAMERPAATAAFR